MTVVKRTALAKMAGNGKSAVIALSAIKELLHLRWPTLAAAVNGAMENLLRQKLGPSDHFAQIDELHWLVVMPSASGEDLHACCLRIAYELHNKVRPPCRIDHIRLADSAPLAADALELSFLNPDQLRECAKQAGLFQEQAAEAPAETVVSEGQPSGSSIVRFMPVWDATRKAVASYKCLSGVASSGANVPVGELLKGAQAALTQVVRALEKAVAANPRVSTVFVPLPYDLLSAPPTRMEFLAACRQLDCGLRQHLYFEISYPPPGVPKSRLIEIVSAIQPFARGVIARAVPNAPSLLDYGGTGLKALALDAHFTQTKQALYDISRLAEASKRLGIAALVGNVASRAVLEHAVRSGIHCMSGPAIGMPVEELPPPSYLDLLGAGQTEARCALG